MRDEPEECMRGRLSTTTVDKFVFVIATVVCRLCFSVVFVQ